MNFAIRQRALLEWRAHMSAHAAERTVLSLLIRQNDRLTLPSPSQYGALRNGCDIDAGLEISRLKLAHSSPGGAWRIADLVVAAKRA
jgi:hypothetical protein